MFYHEYKPAFFTNSKQNKGLPRGNSTAMVTRHSRNLTTKTRGSQPRIVLVRFVAHLTGNRQGISHTKHTAQTRTGRGAVVRLFRAVRLDSWPGWTHRPEFIPPDLTLDGEERAGLNGVTEGLKKVVLEEAGSYLRRSGRGRAQVEQWPRYWTKQRLWKERERVSVRDERDGKVQEKSRLVLDRCGGTAIKIIVFFKKILFNQNLNFENVILCSALSLN